MALGDLRRRPANQRSAAIQMFFFRPWEAYMNGIIYLVGLVVVVLAILSFLGLR